MSEKRKVSFLGLGVMGGAIARHIGNAGHELTIYNRSPIRAEKWQEANPGLAARVAESPAEAARGADVVITCVGNDDDLADVVLGPQGVFSTLGKGGVFIDHTTVSARIARQIAVEARDLQIHCIDAPMSGGPRRGLPRRSSAGMTSARAPTRSASTSATCGARPRPTTSRG